jgi:mono/diheme cytochrome c family protein
MATAAATSAAGFSPEQQEQMKEGETVYRSLCQTCHGEDARGVAVAGASDGSMMGPPLSGSPRVQGHRDYVIKTLLNGMTGPLAGQTYTQVMLPMGAQNDQWIANVASYIRNEFGNTAAFISPAEVARVRAASASRKTMWTYPELEVTLPRLLPVDPTWKATASHNVERAASGLTLAAWTTGAPQSPDMWFQVELPQATMITEVQFDAGAPGGGGRGRGGRGAPPAGAPGRGGAPGAPTGAAGAPAPPPAAPAAVPPTPQRGAAPGGGRGGGSPFGSYPIGYKIQLSMDGKTWGAPVAQGAGSPATTIATFRPVQAKFVRVTQTGTAEDAPAWSVLNFRVYAAGGAPAR